MAENGRRPHRQNGFKDYCPHCVFAGSPDPNTAACEGAFLAQNWFYAPVIGKNANDAIDEGSTNQSADQIWLPVLMKNNQSQTRQTNLHGCLSRRLHLRKRQH